MKKLLFALMLVAAIFNAQSQTALTGSSVVPLPNDSLYQAFGGTPGLARLMDGFVPRLKADPRIGGLFKDTNLDNLKQMLAAQLCVIAGGPCKYEGASMKEAHADMAVRKADFNAVVEALQEAMDDQDIPFSVQNRLLARLAPMHRDIVDKR